MQRVGEDVSEKLDYTPGVFTVERHVRGKWACAHCQTLVQALRAGTDIARRAFDPRLPLQATPGLGANPEMWILGSSLYGAQLAAMLGLPYAFASHFAPDHLDGGNR